MSIQHPCPLPDHPRKGARDGDLWACVCGKVHVRRHWRNYAGEGFEWQATRLNTTLLGPDAHTKQKGARDGLPRGAPVTASDARPPSDTGTTGWHRHEDGSVCDRPSEWFPYTCAGPTTPVLVVDPAEARKVIEREAETHRPAEDWKCACGEDLFGGSAGYSWSLFKSHLASQVLAALAGQGQP